MAVLIKSYTEIVGSFDSGGGGGGGGRWEKEVIT